MKSSITKKTKVVIISFGAFLMALAMALSGLGIYFKLHPKTKEPAKVNPLDFSIDAWDGKTIDGLNFNESYAGRNSSTKTINSAASFMHFINEVNNGNSFENYTIYLNKNIDLAGKTILSIGNEEHSFKGVFDGGHYTIMNANVEGEALFGTTANATIKNVGLYNSNASLIHKAINTNVENCFVRLGEGTLVNEYISINGTHEIKNSFVDTKANGLIGKLDTNNSSENQVSITNCYFTNGETAIAEKVGEAYVAETNVIKATNKSDFANWSYSKEYSNEHDWTDYSNVENSQKLDFTYPIQSGFAKVYLTGSCYESVVVAGDAYIDATNLSTAFVEADKANEAEINLLVEKIFMDSMAEVSNAEISVNALNDTTIVRSENNNENLFVSSGSSKITLGDDLEDGNKITIDGNRKEIEKNNLESGAVVVANGGEVEIHNNVTIKDNANTTDDGQGGAIAIYDDAEAEISANIENCSAAYGGAIYIGEDVELTISNATFSGNKATENGGSIYAEGSLKLADDVVIKNTAKDELGYAEIYAKGNLELLADLIFDTDTKNTAAIRITENNYVDLTKIPQYRIKLYKENISVHEEGNTNGLIFKRSMQHIASTAAEENTTPSQTFDVVNLPKDCVVTMNAAGEGIVGVAATTPLIGLSETYFNLSAGEIFEFIVTVNMSGWVSLYTNCNGMEFAFEDGTKGTTDGQPYLEVHVDPGSYWFYCATHNIESAGSYQIDVSFENSNYPAVTEVISGYIYQGSPIKEITFIEGASSYVSNGSVYLPYGDSFTYRVVTYTPCTFELTNDGYANLSCYFVDQGLTSEYAPGAGDYVEFEYYYYYFNFTADCADTGAFEYYVSLRPSNKQSYAIFIYDGIDPNSAATCFEGSIFKAIPTLTATATAVSYPYNVSLNVTAGAAGIVSITSADTTIVSGKSGIQVEAGVTKTISLTTKKVGSTTVSVSFVPTLVTCYENASTSTSVTISKGTPTLSVTRSPATIGVGNVSTISYRSGVAGKMVISAVTNASSVSLSTYQSSLTAFGSYSINVTGLSEGVSRIQFSFTPTDTTNYNTRTVNADITIIKHTPTVTLSSTTLSAEILGTASFTYKSSVPGTFAISSNNTNYVTVNSGYVKTITASTVDTDYTCTLNGVAIGSTNVTVAFTPTDTTKYATVTKTLSVTVTAPANGVEKPTAVTNKKYTGNAITLTASDITGFDSNKMTIVSGQTATNKGGYNVYIGLKSGYKWMDGTTSNISLPWQIVGNVIPNLTLTPGDYTYGGLRPTPSVSNNPDYAKVTYYVYKTPGATSGESWNWSLLDSSTLDVGTYYMYAVIAESPNYDETTTSPVAFKVNQGTPVFAVNGCTSSESYVKISNSSSSKTTITVMSSVDGILSASVPTGVTVSTAFPTDMGSIITYSAQIYGAYFFSLSGGKITFTFTPNNPNFKSVSHTMNVRGNYSAGITSTPTLTGNAIVGQTLTVTSNAPSGYTSTYQWYYGPNTTLDSATPIHGATSSTLTLTEDLWGYYVFAGVTFQKGTTNTTTSNYVVTSQTVQKPTEITLSHGGMINMQWYDEMKLTFTAPCEGRFVANINKGDGSSIVFSTHASIGFTWNEAYQIQSSSQTTGTTASLWVIANRTELGTSTIDLTFTPTDTTGMYAKSIKYMITVNVEKRIVPLPEDVTYEWQNGNIIALYPPNILSDDMIIRDKVLGISYGDVAKTDIGSYTITAPLGNTTCSMWADGSITPKTYTATITQQTLPSVSNLQLDQTAWSLSWTGVSKNNASIAYTIDIKEYNPTTESYEVWKSILSTGTSYDLKETLMGYDGSRTSLYIFVTARDLLGTYYKDSNPVSVALNEIYQITLVKGEGIAKIVVDGVEKNKFAYSPDQTITIEAYASEHYKVKEWTETASVITSNKTLPLITLGGQSAATATITATAEKSECLVTFAVNDPTAGTVSHTSLWATINSKPRTNSDVLTINGIYVQATPSPESVGYTYAFSKWENVGTITEDCTITANFEKTPKKFNLLPLYITADGVAFNGDIIEGVDYGTSLSVNGNVLTYGTQTYQFSDQEGYSFVRIEACPSTFKGDTTIYAVFEKLPTMVEVQVCHGDTDMGAVSYNGEILLTSATFEVELGSVVTVKDNVIQIGEHVVIMLPWGTWDGSDERYEYIFSDWIYGNGDLVESGTTIEDDYTSFTLLCEKVERTFTVSIETNNSSYGTVSTSSVTNVAYGSTIEIEDNKIVIKKDGTTVATITATASAGYAFDKWVGVVGLVNGNITITANFA